MAPSLEISIPSTSTSTTSKPYTIYTISVKQPLRSYTLQKRYSDFVALNSALTSESGGSAPPTPLPAKSWLKSTISSPELTEVRRQGLEQYLQAINGAEDARWRSCSAWRSFLNLPSSLSDSSKPTEKATETAARAAEMQAAIADPTVWLDIQRDLKGVLREAKSHLARRDQATSAQEQHEAGADAKRCLVRSGTMIVGLESGLKSMSGNSEGSKSAQKGNEKPNADSGSTIGAGEIQRRKGLLLSAKNEREGLENLLSMSSSTVINNNTKSIEAETSRPESQRNISSKSTTSSRRVLGGPPPKETEQTRELDNDGVLQLQSQIMQQQDQDLGTLTQAVQRMKQMGLQINEELEDQNKLLDIMEEDVKRVQDKVDISKKRIQKIK